MLLPSGPTTIIDEFTAPTSPDGSAPVDYRLWRADALEIPQGEEIGTYQFEVVSPYAYPVSEIVRTIGAMGPKFYDDDQSTIMASAVWVQQLHDVTIPARVDFLNQSVALPFGWGGQTLPVAYKYRFWIMTRKLNPQTGYLVKPLAVRGFAVTLGLIVLVALVAVIGLSAVAVVGEIKAGKSAAEAVQTQYEAIMRLFSVVGPGGQAAQIISGFNMPLAIFGFVLIAGGLFLPKLAGSFNASTPIVGGGTVGIDLGTGSGKK